MDAERIATLESTRTELEESATVCAALLAAAWALLALSVLRCCKGVFQLVALAGVQVLQRSVVNLTQDLEFSRHAIDAAVADARRRLSGTSAVAGLHIVTDSGFTS